MAQIKIINNDCLSELKKLENNSIDCFITDPPYFLQLQPMLYTFAELEVELSLSFSQYLSLRRSSTYHCSIYHFQYISKIKYITHDIIHHPLDRDSDDLWWLRLLELYNSLILLIDFWM